MEDSDWKLWPLDRQDAKPAAPFDAISFEIRVVHRKMVERDSRFARCTNVAWAKSIGRSQ
jgi:hypothetical protein